MPRPRRLPLGASGIFLLAALIGGLGGFLGLGFQKGVQWGTQMVMGTPGAANVAAAGATLDWVWRLVIPTAGGLVAGLCLLGLRGHKAPFGIADIVGMVGLRKGTIRIRQSILQIVSSAFTIGSGGSIGREGANSQISATLGATFARWTKSNSRNRAVLLGCGIAAGMAFSYNAPIAASIFVMEAVLGNFAMDVFAPVVVAAVMSTVVRQSFLEHGETAIYNHLIVDPVALDNTLLFSTLVLGAFCGIGGVAFRKTLTASKALFRRIPAPLLIKMALGGLIVGAIGIWWPEVWGNGFAAINKITSPGEAGAAADLVFALLFWKVLATCATAGSGGLGGIFTPNLVVGAAFGVFFAGLLELVFPEAGIRGNQIAFALVGMAGLCAATNHTPITAVVLVFELTRDYELVLPLLLCCIIASVVARLIDKDSYYTEGLTAAGERLPEGIEELAIRTNYVHDIMRSDLITLSGNATFHEVLDRFTNTRRDAIYVIDKGGRIEGQVRLHDVKQYINDPTLSSVVIAHDLTRPVPHVRPQDSLAKTLPMFDDQELEELPVAEDRDGPRLMGRITRRDVIACLSDEVLGQRSLRTRFRIAADGGTSQIELPVGYEIGSVQVPDELIGRALDSVELRADAGLTALLMVHPDEQGIERRVPASAHMILAQGAHLVVLGTSEAITAFRERGMPPASEDED